MDSADHFPQNCYTIYADQSFSFRALFSDNNELGSYTVDIHENFDHHSHSTETAECPVDQVKTPVNPFLFIKQIDIPEGKTEYLANQRIEVPDNIDPGD